MKKKSLGKSMVMVEGNCKMKKRLHKIKKMVGMVLLVSMLGSVPFSVQAAQVSTIGAEYIVPDVTSELYTESDIAGMSAKELCYARNEIYARHGRTFKSSELQTYFNGKSWYNAQYEPDYFDEISNSLVPDIEQKNAALFLKREESLGKYVLDSDGGSSASTSSSVEEETISNSKAQVLTAFATILFQHHMNYTLPTVSLSVGDLTSDDKAYMFGWYQLENSDSRIINDRGNDRNYVEYNAIQAIGTEMFGSFSDTDTQAATNYSLGSDGSLYAFEAIGDNGGLYYFEVSGVRKNDSGNIELYGDIKTYTSCEGNGTSFVEEFKYTGAEAVAGYQFVRVTVS